MNSLDLFIQLENLMERACILETSKVLTPESFPAGLFESGDQHAGIQNIAQMNGSGG